MTMDLQRMVELGHIERHWVFLLNEDKTIISVWEQGCEMHVL